MPGGLHGLEDVLEVPLDRRIVMGLSPLLHNRRQIELRHGKRD